MVIKASPDFDKENKYVQTLNYYVKIIRGDLNKNQ